MCEGIERLFTLTELPQLSSSTHKTNEYGNTRMLESAFIGDRAQCHRTVRETAPDIVEVLKSSNDRHPALFLHPHGDILAEEGISFGRRRDIELCPERINRSP